MCLLRREDKQTIGIFQADDIMYKHVSIITSHASKIRKCVDLPTRFTNSTSSGACSNRAVGDDCCQQEAPEGKSWRCRDSPVAQALEEEKQDLSSLYALLPS